MTNSPVRLLWRDMSDQRRELVFAGFLGFIASFSAVALLGTSAWLIATAAQMPPVLTLTVAAVMVRALALSRAIFRYLERLVGHDAAFRGLTGLRVRVYDQLERLAPTGLAAFGRGDLLARLVADVDAALNLPLRIFLPWAQATLVALATVAFMTWLLPPLGALVAIVSLIAVIVSPWLITRISKAAEARMAPARGRISDSVVRALDGASELLAFSAVGSATAQIRDQDDDVTRSAKRSAVALGLGGGIGVIAQGVAVVGAMAITVPAVADGRLGPVWLAVAALLPLALFEILAGLPDAALSFQGIRASATRLQEITDRPSPVDDPANPVPTPDDFTGLKVGITRATWPTRPQAPALTSINFAIQPHERVAIVGPSGSGKSTLAAVLMGFLPYSGSVEFSGSEISVMDGDQLRRQVGLMSQSAHVFDTSVADNIRLGKPEATDAEIEAAVAQAQLTAFVERLPEGLQTVVGSFGAAMSGGEAQRLALARILVAPRPLVILDEPTEHLDSPTADALMATILATMTDTALVVITHRLAGIEDFDRIIVLEDGAVIAQGSQDELMGQPGWYREQWLVEAERMDMNALLASLPIGREVDGPASTSNR